MATDTHVSMVFRKQGGKMAYGTAWGRQGMSQFLIVYSQGGERRKRWIKQDRIDGLGMGERNPRLEADAKALPRYRKVKCTGTVVKHSGDYGVCDKCGRTVEESEYRGSHANLEKVD